MVECMEENLVQWVFLKDLKYFAKILNLPLERCLGTEVTTGFGRVDFLIRLSDNRLLVIELETGINSKSKLKHCTSQLKNYQTFASQACTKTQKVQVALVYAHDITSKRFQLELSNYATETGIIVRSYSIQKVMQLYNKIVDQLNYTSGVSLSRALALGVTSITWLKKFMIVFLIKYHKILGRKANKYESLHDLWLNQLQSYQSAPWFTDFHETELLDSLPYQYVKDLFPSNTNFYVLKRLAEDFELILIKNSKPTRVVTLTNYGRRFRDDLFMQLKFQNEGCDNERNNMSYRDLTLNQHRLLLEILLNGNFTKIKVNIFHFLRYIHLTEGNWLPKQSTKLIDSECQYLNNLFKSSYNSRTLKDLVLNTCNFCEELGLVKKLPVKDQLYDRVMFSTLGSRVYNYFEHLLHVERERHQIPLQVD